MLKYCLANKCGICLIDPKKNNQASGFMNTLKLYMTLNNRTTAIDRGGKLKFWLRLV